MPRRTTALTAVLAAAALAAGIAPSAASAVKPPSADKELKESNTPPVTTGRPDGTGDGRKN